MLVPVDGTGNEIEDRDLRQLLETFPVLAYLRVSVEFETVR